MQIANLTIDQEKYAAEFTKEAQAELKTLLSKLKEEYQPTAEQIGKEIIATYKEISDLPPGKEQDRLQGNLNHLKAALEHFEATIKIALYDRIINICEIAADIAIKAAVSSLIMF